jgi:predicted  nucleic acid-binding Zn-ribbon protein
MPKCNHDFEVTEGKEWITRTCKKCGEHKSQKKEAKPVKLDEHGRKMFDSFGRRFVYD